MAEYVAGKGTTALGIIGTTLGSLGIANNGIGGILGTAPASYGGCSENMPVNRFELQQEQKIAELKSQIALRDANTYSDQKLLELYKYFDGEIKQIRADSCERWATQGIVNEKIATGMSTLNTSLASVTATVDSITKTAVPKSAICDFGCCNSGCCSD